MNHKDQIKDLVMTVDGGLTVYIVVHNAIFQDSATFKSFLRNLFGRGVPTSKFLEDSEQLLVLWGAIGKKIKVFQQTAYPTLSADEKYYFEILARYAAALQKTVAALVDRQRLLAQRSEGGPQNPMSWEACQQTEKLYQIAVEKYMAIGKELNGASSIIFDE